MLPRNTLRAVVIAVFSALLAALLPMATARAEERTVGGGRLDWGIKASFQSYVTGPIAQGSWSLVQGAATVGGSDFRFHSATGGYDPRSGAFHSAFSGGVHFTGHRDGDGSYQLDLTISRPSVRISGGSGTLSVDMVSKERGSGKVTTTRQVPFASLDLSGIDTRGGTSPVALRRVPATLTAQGAKAFAGYYTAGTALDPVSLSVDVAGPAASRKPSAEPKPTAGGKKTEGRIADAAVDWGVRRTFREYVTGEVTQGRWTLSGGAQDGGALFRFPSGKGSYRAENGKAQGPRLDADFEGSLRFTGRHGLDLTLRHLGVRVEDGKGTLYADTEDAGKAKKHQPLVTFAAGELAAKDGLATLTEVPTRLTAEGAKAFGGVYRAGTAMDPLSLAVALDKSARLPALPDLGSDRAAPSPSASPKTAAEDTGSPQKASSSSDGFPALPLGLAAAALLLAALALFLVRKRRTAAASSAEGGSATPAEAPGTSQD
ncbi:Htaa domain-containing protein [Streptomyces albus]|uniref:Htaa domain-containing protein n=1 Tax=Streptomyces albus (strain ATCC 21838 / DSM 41398 / FERM P-419 / JCM 4703 / NBRC 107858) TaxID=1081613 RepID=A0A0B5ET36_STRA4|nr:Htaa domain-containing protein [Streptomyces albus]AOU80290.1 Htaa domain-containing protein [Streptomyces albus]